MRLTIHQDKTSSAALESIFINDLGISKVNEGVVKAEGFVVWSNDHQAYIAKVESDNNHLFDSDINFANVYQSKQSAVDELKSIYSKGSVFVIAAQGDDRDIYIVLDSDSLYEEYCT